MNVSFCLQPTYVFIGQSIYLQRRNEEFLMRFSLIQEGHSSASLLSIDIIGKLVRVPDKSCLEVSFALFVTKSWKTFHTRPITKKYLHT